MLKHICLWLKSLENWPAIVTVSLVALISMSLLALRSSQFHVKAPDALLHYSPEHLEQFLCLDSAPPPNQADLKACEQNCRRLRQLYIATQVSLDTLLPLSYGVLMGVLVVRYFPLSASKLIVLPMLTTSLDLTENTLLVYLAWTWKCGCDFPALFLIAPWVTSAKWLFAALSVALIVTGWCKQKH